MPVLDQSGTVSYASASDFLADYKTNLSGGGVLAESKANWNLRQTANFRLRVAGLSGEATFRAEIVFVGQGRVGLQIELNPAWKTALAELVSSASEKSPGGAEPAPETGPSEEQQKEADRLAGRILSSGSLEDMESMTPVALNEGNCRQISLFRLISSIASAGQAVSLAASAAGKPLSFRFNSQGNLVQFLSADSDRDLIERLAKRFVITRSQANEVQTQLGGGKAVENVLLEKKLVKLPQLWTGIRDQAVDALDQIRRTGSEFILSAITTGRKTGVSFASLIVPWLERTLDNIDKKVLSDRMRKLDRKYLLPVKEPRWSVESFAFGSKVDQFLRGYLDGTSAMEDALAKYPIAWHEKVRRATWILLALGVLEAHDNPVESDDLPPEVVLTKELEALEKKSLFDQAGVHWSAHPRDFPQAMMKIEQKYGPGGKLAAFSAECRRLCQKRMEMASVAASRLQDRSRRVEQRKRFIDDYQLSNGALLLFRQAELMVLKNEKAKARELLEMAIEIDQQTEYVKLLNSL